MFKHKGKTPKSIDNFSAQNINKKWMRIKQGLKSKKEENFR